MGMESYDMKPISVDAIQHNAENLQECVTLLVESENEFKVEGGYLYIRSDNNDTWVQVHGGHWLVWKDVSDTDVDVMSDKVFRDRFEVN